MAEISFEEFLRSFPGLVEEVSQIKQILLQKTSLEEADKILTIEDAGELLHLSVATLYSKVQKAEIPNCKRGGRLYFSKHDLIEWVKAGRRKTNAEIEELADNFLKKKKGRYHD